MIKANSFLMKRILFSQVQQNLLGHPPRASMASAGKYAPIKCDLEKGKSIKWCACGLSAKQPFCDGSHTATNMTPVAWIVPETKPFFMCVCKRSNTKPLCDGTHKKL